MSRVLSVAIISSGSMPFIVGRGKFWVCMPLPAHRPVLPVINTLPLRLATHHPVIVSVQYVRCFFTFSVTCSRLNVKCSLVRLSTDTLYIVFPVRLSKCSANLPVRTPLRWHNICTHSTLDFITLANPFIPVSYFPSQCISSSISILRW